MKTNRKIEKIKKSEMIKIKGGKKVKDFTLR